MDYMIKTGCVIMTDTSFTLDNQLNGTTNKWIVSVAYVVPLNTYVIVERPNFPQCLYWITICYRCLLFGK